MKMRAIFSEMNIDYSSSENETCEKFRSVRDLNP